MRIIEILKNLSEIEQSFMVMMIFMAIYFSITTIQISNLKDKIDNLKKEIKKLKEEKDE